MRLRRSIAVFLALVPLAAACRGHAASDQELDLGGIARQVGKAAFGIFSSKNADAQKRGNADSSGLAEYLRYDTLVVESPEISSYLEGIVDKLLSHADPRPPRPRLIVVSQDQYDAHVDVYGNLVVATGLLRQAEREDELAAVLSHELAHLQERHTEKRSERDYLARALDSSGYLALAGMQLDAGEDQAKRRNARDRADKVVLATQVTLLLWSDVLSPKWNRDQEAAADIAGAAMMRAAGYDAGTFKDVFERLQNVAERRNQRLELLRTVVSDELRKRLKLRELGPQSHRKHAGDLSQLAVDIANDVKGIGAQHAVDQISGLIAGLNVAHDSSELRATALSDYIAEHPLAVRKRPPSETFAEVLRRGAGGRLLKQDLEATTIMSAIDGGNLRAVRGRVAALASEGVGSPHLRAALLRSYEESNDRANAEANAIAWLASPYAPAGAYRVRAAQLARSRRDNEVMQLLDGAATRLDAWPSFLPSLIEAARRSDNVPAAEAYTDRCRDADPWLDRASTTTLIDPNDESGLYQRCERALGYSLDRKREQEQKRRQAETRKQTEAVQKVLKDLFH